MSTPLLFLFVWLAVCAVVLVIGATGFDIESEPRARSWWGRCLQNGYWLLEGMVAWFIICAVFAFFAAVMLFIVVIFLG